MKEVQKTKSDSAITVGFVGVMILLRVLSENIDYDVQVIAVINGFMFVYVFYKIHSLLKAFFENRKCKNKIFDSQYKAYKKTSVLCLGIFLFLGAIYLFLVSRFQRIYNVGGCINDIMAIITFGFSLEDDNIYEYVKKQFMNKDYTI